MAQKFSYTNKIDICTGRFRVFSQNSGCECFLPGVFYFLMRNFKHLKARVYLQTCFGKNIKSSIKTA